MTNPKSPSDGSDATSKKKPDSVEKQHPHASGLERAASAAWSQPKAQRDTPSLSSVRQVGALHEMDQAAQKHDGEALLNLLEPLKRADRDALLAQYKKEYGTNILAAFSESPADYKKLNAVIKREDGIADVVGQLDWAIARIGQNYREPKAGHGIMFAPTYDLASEKVLIDALAGLSAKDIDQLRQTLGKQPTTDQGKPRNLDTELLKNQHISPETREVLSCFLKGKENCNDTNTVRRLADLALKQNRPDIFQYAFLHASPKARQSFKDSEQERLIDQNFSGIDRQIAHDYVDRGAESPITAVRGDRTALHVNKEHIEYTITHLSEGECI
jgi:hypothetical protein